MTLQKQISLLLPTFLLLLTPAIVSAATISLQATPASPGVGDVVRVSIILDSAIPTNAFSGTLSYTNNLEPIALSDGNSIINMWITHPVISTGAPITFAGITPGGFSGSGGTLFSVLFRAKAIGKANISLGDIEVLRNDGVGGRELVRSEQLVLSIGSKSSGGYTEPIDRTPPESFTAYLGNDSQLFDGRNYLVFTTVDKSSGVDRYVVAESRLPSFLFSIFPLLWTTARVSPYVIVDQNLTSTLYVKAFDRSGNERLSVFPPQHLFTTYEKMAFLVILIVFVFLWLYRSARGRRFRKNL
jgi:hypothetical protein